MKHIAVIIACVFIGLISFHCGRKSALMPSFGDVIIQADTSVIRDTFAVLMPPPVSVKPVGSVDVPARDTSRVGGELMTRLPIERKVYETPRFRAEVSGYMASLDNLKIYGESRQVTRTIREAAYKNTLTIGAEPMWAGGWHVPIMADYSHAVLPWLDVGAGVGYDPVLRIPVIRTTARVRFSW